MFIVFLSLSPLFFFSLSFVDSNANNVVTCVNVYNVSWKVLSAMVKQDVMFCKF